MIFDLNVRSYFLDFRGRCIFGKTRQIVEVLIFDFECVLDFELVKLDVVIFSPILSIELKGSIE